jgi:hypothetical protein
LRCAFQLLWHKPAFYTTSDVHHRFGINMRVDSVELLCCVGTERAEQSSHTTRVVAEEFAHIENEATYCNPTITDFPMFCQLNV